MFKIGAEVYSTDGQVGKLSKVVIDPEHERVSHLIVEKGFLQRVDRVVPLKAMAEQSDERITLNVSTAQFEQFPEFNAVHFRTPDAGWEHGTYQIDDPAHVLKWGIHYSPPLDDQYVLSDEEIVEEGVDADQSVIGKGTKVYDRDGELGEVTSLSVDDNGQLTHIVVRQGLLGKHYVIPMTAISASADTDGVGVDLTREQVMALAAPEAENE